MLEIAQDFEQIAPRFAPVVLIGPGIVCVIVGLFVWLAGLRFRRVLIAVLGAAIGSILGFFVIGRSFISAMIVTGLTALIAVVFERLFIAVLTACLVAALGFAIGHLIKPYIGISEEAIPINQSRKPVYGPTLGVGESVQLMKTYIIDVSNKIKQACSEMPLYKWAIIAVLVVIFITGRFYFWRLTSALYCAISGTILIFAGTILLLLYKGAMPVTGIYHRASLYTGVFTAMTAFGTIEQLLLCPWLKGKVIRRREAKRDKDEDKASRGKQNWRTV
jgi:hypothetical protein